MELKTLTLPPKLEIFCNEYIIDGNGARAAIAAGYSENGAKTAASRALTNVNVRLRIEELKNKAVEKAGYSVQYVLQNLNEVAMRCMQKVPVMEWDPVNKCMVQAVDENGNSIWKFDSQGANKALELLGKHAGAFEADNLQKKPVIAIQIAD